MLEAHIHKAIGILEARVADFYEPGNRLVRGLCADLALPWTLAEPVAGFERASFMRWEWGTDTEGAFPAAEMYERHVEVDLERLAKSMDTASPVIWWRGGALRLGGHRERCGEHAEEGSRAGDARCRLQGGEGHGAGRWRVELHAGGQTG